MNFRFSIFDFRLPGWGIVGRGLLIALLGSALSAKKLTAQGNSSLSDTIIESAAADATVERESVKTLTESLAASNAEAELFRRKFSELQLRMEALGLESADKDKSKLEQRLLRAVSDLQLAKKEREQYRDQMLRLTEAMLNLLKSSTGGDAKARAEVEAQVRSTNALVAKSASGTTEAQPSLMDGSVVSVKDEWSLVVGNLGERLATQLLVE